MSIVLDAITKRFGTQLVVDRLTLSVSDGELFVLLGASGSGKSTVLRMIAGLTSVDGGRIVLQGTDVTSMAPQQRGTGFVFQNYSIFRHMSVAENIEFGLMIRRESLARRAARREELLDLVGLTGLGHRRAHQLSGGQLQRVALARALAYDPKVLLLDEPFGALDVKIRSQVRRRLRDIQRRLGVTAILVTHDQEEAFELADRIGVMERGHLLEVGPPEELYLRPQTSYVATFLGAGNILLGRARGGKAHFGHVVLPIGDEVPHEEGARVEVLIRPEDVHIAAEVPPDSAHDGGVLLGHGEVVDQSFAGPLRRLRLRMPRLKNTRQTAPRVPFGEVGLFVDMVQPTETPVPDTAVYVACRRWRVLQQSRPRVVTCCLPGAATGDRAAAAARALSEQMNAALTVLGVSPDADAAEAAQASLRQTAGDASVRVRQGEPVEQVLVEQQESLYDIVVVDAAFAARGPGLSDAVQHLVDQIDGAVLVVRDEVSSFKRLLVCTAAGEPGKSNVRLGAWLARRLGAEVTLLHVVGEGAEPSVFVRRHLEKAERAIAALDVPVNVLMPQAATPAEGIISVAAEYDLIVVGGHGPTDVTNVGLDDVTQQVLAQLTRPLLVVSWESD